MRLPRAAVPTGPGLLSELPFAAFLQYSPHGKNEISKESRGWRDAVKQDAPGQIARAVQALAVRLESAGLKAFLGPEIALAPTPRSVPLRSRDALWPARRVCEELVEQGLGSEILEIVVRKEAVRKSAYAPRGERPEPEDHLRSLSVAEKPLLPHPKITVVDDFVTRGATLLAVASLVHDAFPESEVRAFALLRTMGLVPEIDTIVAPCSGWIRYVGGKLLREP